MGRWQGFRDGHVTVHHRWAAMLLAFLFVAGPGLIVMTADNDSGAVSTYCQAGALHGGHLLWLLLFLLPVTYFCQEMVVRLGIVTGEGHAAMIYKRFGRWWGNFSLLDLLLVNFMTMVTEFAMVDQLARAAGLDPRVAVVGSAVLLLYLVGGGGYRRWERLAVGLCALQLAWFWITWRTCPPAAQIAQQAFVAPAWTGSTIFLAIAIVGTTVAPWQLFFQQACVADKRLLLKDLVPERADTFLSAIFTIVSAAVMLLAGWALTRTGRPWTDVGGMANDLGAVYGPAVRWLLLGLCFDACLLGATAVSLASAWAWGEVQGWPHSLDLHWSEAPGFYGVYLLCVGAAAGLVLIPGAPLQLIIIGVQVLAGIMLPSCILFLLLLLMDKEVMGKQVNERWRNWVLGIIIAALFAMSAVLGAQAICPRWFPR